MLEIRIPQGMKDVINEECEKKRYAQNIIEHVFMSFGYHPIMTPMIEYYDTYQKGYSHVDAGEMYKFFDQEGDILTLREDNTVPICRVCASKYAFSQPPFRFFYTSDVFKVRHMFAGKRSEVTDCGIECIGLDETCDIEILYMALTVMEQLQFHTYQIEIGNARFFQSATEALHLSKEETGTLARLTDCKSVVNLQEYVDSLNIEGKAKDFFLQLPFLSGKDCLSKAKSLCFTSEMEKEIEFLSHLYKDLQQLHMAEHVSFDLGKIPHLDYYTGIIFEGYIPQSGTSVLSGGRYDNLMVKFGRDLPACGFSIKLDYILDAIKMDKTENIQLFYPKGKEVQAIQKARELRTAGHVEIIPWDQDDWEVRS